VPGAEVQLPTLNVEDTDGKDGGGGGGGQGSRRPSKLTLDAQDDTGSEPFVGNVAELASTAFQQLEPEVGDAQLAEVRSDRPAPRYFLIFTDRSSGPRAAIGPCVCVCISGHGAPLARDLFTLPSGGIHPLVI